MPRVGNKRLPIFSLKPEEDDDDIIVKDEEETLPLFKPPIQLGRKPEKFRPPPLN